MEKHQTPPRYVRYQLLEKENLSSSPSCPSSPSFKTPQAPPSTPMPPSSSKLLRQHFEQISLTPSRRLMESAAVRVSALKNQTSSPPPRDRMGYDWTSFSPSKELLRSTVASRNQQVPAHELELAIIRCRGDHDPVASTLLQDDDDDDMEEVSPMSGHLKHWPGLVRPVATKLPR